jgi:hypothetical protein
MGAPTALAMAVLLAGSAGNGEVDAPTREEFLRRVEPICKRGDEANDRILKGSLGKIRRDELPAAGHQVIRAAGAFGKSVEQLEAVPRPVEDEVRLERWFERLEQVEAQLRDVGVALKRDNKVRANHAAIRAERAGNAANNASIEMGFHHCRFRGSRLT